MKSVRCVNLHYSIALPKEVILSVALVTLNVVIIDLYAVMNMVILTII